MPETNTKPFYKSIGFWGTMLTTFATFVPKYEPYITTGTTLAGQVLGIATILYGRFRKGGGQELTILPQSKQ